jgi:hypothetical protein
MALFRGKINIAKMVATECLVLSRHRKLETHEWNHCKLGTICSAGAQKYEMSQDLSRVKFFLGAPGEQRCFPFSFVKKLPTFMTLYHSLFYFCNHIFSDPYLFLPLLWSFVTVLDVPEHSRTISPSECLSLTQ